MATSRKSGPGGAEIETQIRTIQEDISTLASLLTQVAEGKSADARKAALDEAQKLLDRSKQSAEQVSARTRQVAGSVEDYIKEKPFQSAVLALLAGVLIGSWTRR
ncbi:MAG: hypothetical protein LPL00_05350 [Alphaproteobacteria bacterium]|nr:hypothetical protein [Alphaproteobacteria bacterium]MDX5368972.1 hypothetical protein [Alphaproteobacteria bacterium]MDX5463667.1 hypothetical protein [Alphaproteobacteria bacterium]